MSLSVIILATICMLATLSQALLVPSNMAQVEMETQELYRKLIEDLHEQSGDFHQRFKALSFQQGDSQEGAQNDDNDSRIEGHKKKTKKPNDGHGGERLVPVVLGVMSKCPDAEICESVFDKTLEQVSDLVDIKTIYIGQLNKTSKPYGVDCKHGGSECDGNVQQLCVRDNSEVSQRDWWNFIQCQNFQNLNRVGDISVAKQCSKVIHKDWDKDFSSCYTGGQGAKLLQESVKQAHDTNITVSCSVVINEKLVCVHDGSWKQCTSGHEPGDFEKYIKDEYKAINGGK